MTKFTSDSVRDRATILARGTYQRALLTGEQLWSGSDIRGGDGGGFARSRKNFLTRLQKSFDCEFKYEYEGRYRTKVLYVRAKVRLKRPPTIWQRLELT